MKKIANTSSTSLKELFQHELLNKLTLLGILLEEKSPSLLQKERAKGLLQMMGLLIAHEILFLEKKPRFFRQKIDIFELLNMLLSSFQNEIRSRNIEVILPPRKEIFISADRYYITEALSKILARLLTEASFLHFSFPAEKTIVLEHDIPVKPELRINTLSSYLNVKALSYENIAYQVGLHILKTHHKPPRISDGKMEIFL